MSRVRALMLWLLMAALPLQGLAAATWLHCAGQASPAASAEPAHPHGAAGAQGRHVHGPAHVHDAAPQHGAAAMAPGVQASSNPGDWPGLDHECGVCAACFSVVAPLPILQVLQVAAGPTVVAVLTPLAPHSRAPTLPDKPPRA